GTLGGLDGLKKGQQTFVNFKHDSQDPTSLSDNRIYAITQDRRGNLYIGTYGGGLNIKRKYSTNTFEVVRPPQISSNYIRTLFEDSKGNLWVGTLHGLNLMRAEEDTFKVFKSDPKDSNTISGNIITSIIEDRRNNIWIGTYNDG